MLKWTKARNPKDKQEDGLEDKEEAEFSSNNQFMFQLLIREEDGSVETRQC